MSGYELSRQWFDFLFENPDLTNVSQTALYMWLIELNNRKGFSEKFIFNTDDACSYTGIKDRKTVWSALNKLTDFGFVTIISKATNQNQVTTISIINNKVNSNKCLDKAIRLYNNYTSEGLAEKQQINSTTTSEGLAEPLAIVHSIKQLNNKTINKETNKQPATRRVNLFADLFTAWFKDKFELTYSMKTKDFVGIATIEKYCKENAKGEPIEMFKFILENYDSLAEFYQTNINPSFIASRISEIASMLKKQHTKTQIVKQVEKEPVNRKWFPSPSQYYSECISKKQEPFNFWTGNEMTEDEKISEYKIHKVGEYRYA